MRPLAGTLLPLSRKLGHDCHSIGSLHCALLATEAATVTPWKAAIYCPKHQLSCHQQWDLQKWSIAPAVTIWPRYSLAPTTPSEGNRNVSRNACASQENCLATSTENGALKYCLCIEQSHCRFLAGLSSLTPALPIPLRGISNKSMPRYATWF